MGLSFWQGSLVWNGPGRRWRSSADRFHPVACHLWGWLPSLSDARRCVNEK